MLIENMISPVNPQKPENVISAGGLFYWSSGSEKPEQPDAMRVFTSHVIQGIVSFMSEV
jgi:hypothetical protein